MIQIFLTIGVFCIIISGLILGVWTDGERQRAVFHSESEQYRNLRTKIALYAGIVGVVSLSIAGIGYSL
ncbi:DUF5316 family protein [Cytobacillus solani]|uniref:Uncharacterized protein n=1 Tax=Cytobacillus solani TaxID=1637975 RepID=A0A0Q3VHB0_9BACI|nr:DUF5316 family protein [Cytobacillus solani]KQL19914.1 hypothetical protein AN957_15975 [Cytobacillus solani]